jgi:fatty acid desaturase
MKIGEILSPLDRGTLSKLLIKSNRRALEILLFNYAVIGLCFASVIIFPFFWVWIIAAAVLAGRQLGLAILMHDCAHSAFFETKKQNQWFGTWLCAAPIFADLDQYRTYHLEHHRTAGSEEDPDRSNYIHYPVSMQSFRRKLVRDLSGVTGLKILILLWKMNAGTVKYQLSYDENKKTAVLPISDQLFNVLKNLGPSLIFHAIFIAIFAVSQILWAYSLWWLAWMTFYMVFSRIRNAAEHAATSNSHSLNPLENTRTTLARPWERLFVAPNYVNYHLEHHLMFTIPPYRLAEFHEELKKHRILPAENLAAGYGEVLRKLLLPSRHQP